MDDLLATLPSHFRTVPYNGACVPDGRHDLSQGANCQRYAYAVLAQFSIVMPPFRSSELWADRDHSALVSELMPLDLLLFGRHRDPYGAHVAVYAGEGRALHLCRLVGLPAVWPVVDFQQHAQYACYIGAKRALRH